MPVNHLSIDHSEDVHYQATLLRAWDQDYTQLQAGPFRGSVRTLRNGGLKLFSERMNRATFQKGSLPNRRLAFGLPVRAAGSSHICGEEGDQNSLLIFSGQSGFEFRSPGDFEFFGIEIDLEDSTDYVLCELVAALKQSFTKAQRVIPLERKQAANLRRYAGVLLADDGTQDRKLNCADYSMAFNRRLVGWLLDMLHVAETGQQCQTTRHWDTVTAIRQLVIESPCCPISVAELTVELGLSRRTLQIACRDVVGLSPVEYLRALRLNEARRMMKRASSVTEVATQFGFWHLGYFARYYCAMFGELPSQTLDRYRLRLT